MSEAWLTHGEQSAVRPGADNHRESTFLAVPEAASGRRDRRARWLATAVSALCAFVGVLVVSIAAVLLALT
jgi:hypothetical protein